MGSTTVEAPDPRDIGQEAKQTLEAQTASAPDQFAAYAKFAPQYAATDVNILGQGLFGPGYEGNLTDINRRLTEEAAAQSQAANTAQRTADLNDVANLAPQVQDTLQQSNPELYAARAAEAERAATGIAPTASQQQLEQMAAAERNGVDVGRLSTVAGRDDVSVNTDPANALIAAGVARGGGGPGDIQKLLEQQALEQLKLGGTLGAQDLRQAQQAARGAYAAKGLGDSNQAIGAEILNTDAMTRQRLLERQQLASAVDAQGFGQRQQAAGTILQGAGLASNLAGMQLSASQGNQNNALARAGLNTQIGQSNQQSALAEAQFMEAQRQAQMQQLAGANAMEMQRQQLEQGQRQQAFQNQLATYFDPYQGVLGRNSVNQGTNASLQGGAAQQVAGAQANTAQMFNPFNAYASDLYNTNYNAEAAANIATANNRAGIIGGALGAVGSIGGGLLGNAGLFGG